MRNEIWLVFFDFLIPPDSESGKTYPVHKDSTACRKHSQSSYRFAVIRTMMVSYDRGSSPGSDREHF